MEENKSSTNVLAFVIVGLILLLVSEWSATKQAACDAWHGKYSPVDENIENTK